MSLGSVGDDMRVVVFGATGAIGEALVTSLAKDPAVGVVHAGSRRPPVAPPAKAIPFRFDLQDEGSIAKVAFDIGAAGPLDLVIVATGVLHDGQSLQPEKSWRDFGASAFAHSFAVNATGPALIAKHTLPLLTKTRRSIFATLSARVGSIEDNHLGGWAAYRASKAALHQIVRTAAIELARKNPGACCVALHPGTVDSELSKPFQRGVPSEKLFTPTESAEHLLRVIRGLTPAHTGLAFAWDGARIPF